jgi:hypothetical protein
MTNVPGLDWDGSGSDVRVTCQLQDKTGKACKKNQGVDWPCMDDMQDPVWNKVSQRPGSSHRATGLTSHP